MGKKTPHYIQGLIGRIEITEEIVSEIEDKDTLSNLNNRGEKNNDKNLMSCNKIFILFVSLEDQERR